MKSPPSFSPLAIALLILPAAAFVDGFHTLNATSGALFPDTALTGAGFLLYGIKISATGIITGLLTENSDGSYSKDSVTYSFAVSAPEPVAIGLLLRGIASLATWCNRLPRTLNLR